MEWMSKISNAGIPEATFGEFVDEMHGAQTRSTLFVADTAQQISKPDEWRDIPLADFFTSPPVVRLSWPPFRLKWPPLYFPSKK